MLNSETLKDVFELIGAFSSVFIIYYALNYIMNSHIEEKHLKIYGYNMKSINYYLLIVLASYFEFAIISMSILTYFQINIDTFSDLNKFSYIIKIICMLIFILIIAIILKKINILYRTFFISALFGIISAIFLKLSFNNPHTIYILLIIFVVLPVAINSTLLKKYNNVMQEIIFYKNIIHSNFKEDINSIKGTILSETNDEIVIDVNKIVQRYKKSDIFCIKEYQNPYSSILEKIDYYLTDIQNNLRKYIFIDICKYIKSRYICKSIKGNILNLNKIHDNHYDDILKNMKRNILKIEECLSNIEKDTTTKRYINIKFSLNIINNEIRKIEKQNQEPPAN